MDHFLTQLIYHVLKKWRFSHRSLLHLHNFYLFLYPLWLLNLLSPLNALVCSSEYYPAIHRSVQLDPQQRALSVRQRPLQVPELVRVQRISDWVVPPQMGHLRYFIFKNIVVFTTSWSSVLAVQDWLNKLLVLVFFSLLCRQVLRIWRIVFVLLCFILIFYYFYASMYVYTYVHLCVCWRAHMHRGQKVAWRSWFSPSTMSLGCQT